MTREIRPIYTLAPKAHDMAQRQSIDPERYSCAIETPPPKQGGNGGALFIAALVSVVILYALMSR